MTTNCPCAKCREERIEKERERDPYYQPPERSNADVESDLYDPPRCEREGYRGPPDHGGAGW